MVKWEGGGEWCRVHMTVNHLILVQNVVYLLVKLAQCTRAQGLWAWVTLHTPSLIGWSVLLAHDLDL
jgi:hypothetical protein